MAVRPAPLEGRELAVRSGSAYLVSGAFETKLDKFAGEDVRTYLNKLGREVSAYTGNNVEAVGRFYDSVARFDGEGDAIKAGFVLSKIAGGKNAQIEEARGIASVSPMAFVVLERDVAPKSLEEERKDAALRLAGASSVLDKMPLGKVVNTPMSQLKSEIVRALERVNATIDRNLEKHAEQKPLKEEFTGLSSLFIQGLPYEGAEAASTLLAFMPLERR